MENRKTIADRSAPQTLSIDGDRRHQNKHLPAAETGMQAKEKPRMPTKALVRSVLCSAFSVAIVLLPETIE